MNQVCSKKRQREKKSCLLQQQWLAQVQSLPLIDDDLLDLQAARLAKACTTPRRGARQQTVLPSRPHMKGFDRRAVAAAECWCSLAVEAAAVALRNFFTPLCVCVGRVCHKVLETQETREKTRTQKFGSGSGGFSLNKISGFSGHTSENPKNSGRLGFQKFSGFCTLQWLQRFQNFMFHLFFFGNLF